MRATYSIENRQSDIENLDRRPHGGLLHKTSYSFTTTRPRDWPVSMRLKISDMPSRVTCS